MINQNRQDMVDILETKSRQNTIAVSSIVVSEIYYGVAKKGSKRLQKEVERFLSPLEIFAFDENAAKEYALIRSTLEKQGRVIGNFDMLIAAHAKSLKATLVTNNTNEFERVDSLLVEDWSK